MPESPQPAWAEIETPALLVDLDIMERNMETMRRFFAAKAARHRPHFKNHRVLALAARQMEQGAIGITCAHVWQAEKLASHGIRSILIANEIVGESPIRRLAQLAREVPVIVAVDNAKVVSDLARAARNLRAELSVLVDVDVGLKRCGVSPGRCGLELARYVVESGLRFRGLMGYEGHLQALPPGPEKQGLVTETMNALLGTRRLIEAASLPVEIVSCGGTGDYWISAALEGITENQAGSYLLMDAGYAPVAPEFSPALSVLTTVISKTAGERIVVDTGVKAISGERGLPDVKDMPGLRLKVLHAEHAPVEILDPDTPVEVGDKIELQVQYHDGTINLHRRMYGLRKGKLEEIFTIEYA